MLKGTPYVYQGEEIGMTNMPFTAIDQYRDIETLNMHRLHVEAGLPEADFIAGANANGRDNSRTPMQWCDAPHAAFTSGQPWIAVNPNAAQINVASQVNDETSVLAHYRRLIALRKERPIVVTGRFASWLDDHRQAMIYTRSLHDETLLVAGNFTASPLAIDLPSDLQGDWHPLVTSGTVGDPSGPRLELGPFASAVWHRRQCAQS
jgi:oligo-1,6-glucosidase